jgi:hypothetical protein
MVNDVLLSRDAFREGTFQRDGHKCIVPRCGAKADDAHHIIERRLWTDPKEKEGYFLSNGASLCESHHRFGAETCALQPQILREWARLPTKIPSTWDPAKVYDKWGIALKQPARERVKYPSTPYLPQSPGVDPNDINLPDLKPFLNQPLVVTVKMDGSNSLLTRDLVAARNGGHADHPSFDMLKALHKQRLGALIPEGIQVFGEWLYAQHSIAYRDDHALAGLFQPFAVYDQKTQMFAGWEGVAIMAKVLKVPTVPVLSHGVVYTEEWKLAGWLQSLAEDTIEQGHEGIVVRTAYPFPYGSFEGYETTNGKTSWRVAPIAKYVRANHVQTDDGWTHGPIVRNEVKS